MNVCHPRPGTRLAALLLLSFTLAAAGCDEPERRDEARSRPRIGVLIYRQDDIYISMVRQALQKSLEGRAELSFFFAEDDQLTQNEQLDKLAAERFDGLAVNLVDTQAAASVVDLLKKADIPVVFFNREPDLNMIKLYSKAAFVGTNTLEAGLMQGDIIARLWRAHPEFDRNGDGELQYIMFQGNADNPEAVARTEYSVRRAREHGVGMRQIGQTFVCNWDSELALEAMRAALAMHAGDIELVISNNDSMALGALQALTEAGFNLPDGNGEKFIPVVGVDAIPPAIAAIDSGVMSATVKQDGEAMGRAIAALLLNIINGKNFLEGTPYSWDASGAAVRIPYSPVSHE